jgi:ribonucleoside-diphosphate reductase alpha chain
MTAWKLGLKAIAVYRDGAKRVQPLATKAEQPIAVARPESDVPPCNECGTAMVRSSSCFRCLNCGTVNGCS